jgi:CHAT domain-containing protein/tetratricopeptide (TPR) repeat protein
VNSKGADSLVGNLIYFSNCSRAARLAWTRLMQAQDSRHGEESVEDRQQLANTLLSFLNAPTWDETQEIVEEHPELLGEEAQILLGEIEAGQADAEAVRVVQEGMELLRRCRNVGIPRAFSEKLLSTEALADSARLGVTPEEFLAVVRAAGKIPPELLELLAEMAAEGVISTPEDLEHALAGVHDRLRRAIATEFVDNVHLAQEEEQRYLLTGDRAALDSAIAAWSRILEHGAFSSASEEFRVTALNDAGGVFLHRYQAGGDIGDLNRALDLLKHSVRETPPDSSDLLSRLNNVGVGLRSRFERTGQEVDLEEAIQIFQGLVEATPPNSPNLPGYLCNLGTCLRDRFGCTAREADLEEAIRAARQAVEATPRDSINLSMCLNNLGNGLSERFRHSRQEADLDEAIQVHQQAVQATPLNSLDLHTYLNNLGNGLRSRFRRTGREADLEEAIRVARHAVQATSQTSPHMPLYLNNLGFGLSDRFRRSGRVGDLDESIRTIQQAVEATPPDSPDLPSRLSNLGYVLRDRYRRTGRTRDLDEAIRSYQRAARATPPGSTELPGILGNLGTGLRDRFAHTGREADLEEAIRIYRQAMEATPPDSPLLGRHLSNLGNVLRDRFDRMGHETDLEEAIRVFQQAVGVTPLNSWDLSLCLSNLGNGLCDRFRYKGQEVDLEEAIRVFQRAVQASPPDSPELPLYLNNLGSGLGDLFRRTGREADLEEAIRVRQRAVEASPPDSPELPMYLTNLGNGLRDRFRRTGREVDLAEATQAYRRACELGALVSPQAVVAATCSWGRWAVERQQWGETAEAYGYGLATGRQLLGRQLHRMHKENWLRDLQEMSAPAAYALAKLGRYEEAVAVMECGRGRLLAETLQRHRRDLERLPANGHKELYDRYLEIVETQKRLTQTETVGEHRPDSLLGQARLDAIIATNVAFDQVVAEIQEVAGYADFLAETKSPTICSAAQEGLLVYLIATSTGGLALLVMDKGNVQPVWLDALTDRLVHKWLGGSAEDLGAAGWLRTYQNWLVAHSPRTQRAWFAAIDDLTYRLWTCIVEPLAAALHRGLQFEPYSVPSITLIPAGLLALLPLHSAWTEDVSTPTGRRYFLDEFTVNYAPSALVLGHALDAARHTSHDRILAVEEPCAAGASLLPNASAEVAAIAGLFDSPVILRGPRATRRAVLAQLSEADVVHFSCHGSNNWQSPLESGLLMADDESGNNVLLTVRDLLESRQTGGRLATLSACETGIVGTDLLDEVVALPSALLQAGFGGVAASLWSVADISTAMLMEHFYRCWREDGLPPAQALRAAQRWVRDTTNREKAEYFKRYSPELSGRRLPEGVAIDFYNEAMSRDLESRDFAHPFWWAAFYLSGV